MFVRVAVDAAEQVATATVKACTKKWCKIFYLFEKHKLKTFPFLLNYLFNQTAFIPNASQDVDIPDKFKTNTFAHSCSSLLG